VKPIKFHELKDGTLFRIFAERRAYYDRCDRKEGFVRSQDHTVYKRHGSSHSSSKAGKVVILSPHDLVMEYQPRGGK
jgi:hypothetical protein